MDWKEQTTPVEVNLYLVYISELVHDIVANKKRAKWSPSCLYFQTGAQPTENQNLSTKTSFCQTPRGHCHYQCSNAAAASTKDWGATWKRAFGNLATLPIQQQRCTAVFYNAERFMRLSVYLPSPQDSKYRFWRISYYLYWHHRFDEFDWQSCWMSPEALPSINNYTMAHYL